MVIFDRHDRVWDVRECMQAVQQLHWLWMIDKDLISMNLEKQINILKSIINNSLEPTGILWNTIKDEILHKPKQ